MPPPPRDPTAGRSLRSVPQVPAARQAPARAPAPRAPRPAVAAGPSRLPLLLWPALVTLGVTLLRLVGELRGWNSDYFSPLPGGGLAVVGIAWLVPFVGAYLGWHLARARVATPDLAGLFGWPLVALGIGLGIGYGLAKVVQPSWTGTALLWAVVSLLVVAMSVSTWPVLGKLLLAYAAAARVPVLIVMALAIRGGWRTHYDSLPPGFPILRRPALWFWTGLVPQATVWVAYTVAIGMAFSAVGIYLARRQR